MFTTSQEHPRRIHDYRYQPRPWRGDQFKTKFTARESTCQAATPGWKRPQPDGLLKEIATRVRI